MTQLLKIKKKNLFSTQFGIHFKKFKSHKKQKLNINCLVKT